MNDCYLNFLVSFRALFSLDVGANLVNSKQTIGIILPDLSLLGYAVPVESFGIGLFVILFAYLIIEYNVQLLSHEKFKIAMNMLHTAHTPLILLRNQLEELKTGNLPEPLSQQVEEALGYAECIIYCNRNIATLNKVNKRIPPKTSTVNLELSTYVTSIVNQCRAHANSRQIRLTVGECSDCVSCRINENIMTAALQHLINKMILISESGCCISINVTHTMNSWQLQISNNEIAGQRAGKMFPFIPIIFPVYGYSDLWTVRKIIRLHGGKITGCRHGKAATFQIVIPTDCHCQNQSCPVLKHSSAKTKTQIDDSCESPKSDKQNTKARETSHILLVMADKLFSDYLKKTLSRYFQISVLDNPELLMVGEAYFVVAKNKKRPFIVNLNGPSVHVLGTSFDVQAYPENKDIVICLDEGHVNLTLSSAKEYPLLPGEKLIYNKESELCRIIKNDHSKQVSMWKDNVISFKDTPLTEVVKVLNRWYNVNFKIEDEQASKYVYTLTSDNTILEKVLQDLEKIAPVKFEYDEVRKEVTVRMKQDGKK